MAHRVQDNVEGFRASTVLLKIVTSFQTTEHLSPRGTEVQKGTTSYPYQEVVSHLQANATWNFDGPEVG